jgi:hypothetical protein
MRRALAISRTLALAVAAAPATAAFGPCGEFEAAPECEALCTKLEQCDPTFWMAFMVMEDCQYNCGQSGGNAQVACWMACDDSDSCEDWDACRTECSGEDPETPDLTDARATCVASYRQCHAIWQIPTAAVESTINTECFEIDDLTAGSACLRAAEAEYFECMGKTQCQTYALTACQGTFQNAFATCKNAK